MTILQASKRERQWSDEAAPLESFTDAWVRKQDPRARVLTSIRSAIVILYPKAGFWQLRCSKTNSTPPILLSSFFEIRHGAVLKRGTSDNDTFV